MKERWLVLSAACMLLLAGCAGMALFDPAPSWEEREAPQAEEAYEEPAYEIVPFTTGNQLRSEDGKLLYVYNYQIVLLNLGNADAVSPADAEAAERTAEAFNAKMRAVQKELTDQASAFGEDALAVHKEFGSLPAEFEDDVDMGAEFFGDIVSVVLNRYSYTGGVHPNRYAASYLFDLPAGQFIDPTQLAEDPEAFRTGAAALLQEKAEVHPAREAFWQDYADILTHWNEETVQFTAEGMWVIYSPYGLGPYAIGDVALTLDWEELAPLLGPEGMARLGRAETQ